MRPRQPLPSRLSFLRYSGGQGATARRDGQRPGEQAGTAQLADAPRPEVGGLSASDRAGGTHLSSRAPAAVSRERDADDAKLHDRESRADAPIWRSTLDCGSAQDSRVEVLEVRVGANLAVRAGDVRRVVSIVDNQQAVREPRQRRVHDVGTIAVFGTVDFAGHDGEVLLEPVGEAVVGVERVVALARHQQRAGQRTCLIDGEALDVGLDATREPGVGSGVGNALLGELAPLGSWNVDGNTCTSVRR